MVKLANETKRSEKKPGSAFVIIALKSLTLRQTRNLVMNLSRLLEKRAANGPAHTWR